ncbi:hypothetical protein CRG98_015225 [Punica granatum]|uniref:Uncharacterized protein n=1 Tax=Punica granatum TaxID=22663 RepID=A0A2I0K733_PUNGR|nr:hypothetical protein CRG98_015225 [Punica granatum]
MNFPFLFRCGIYPILLLNNGVFGDKCMAESEGSEDGMKNGEGVKMVTGRGVGFAGDGHDEDDGERQVKEMEVKMA